ncbi:MAG: deoxyguanosinetriphosphate triphosphohydrolase [Clostridia bacterium]|nr:deoxyguanosinetriphosphate triphosphohydrolase [Clostridia bacterium]
MDYTHITYEIENKYLSKYAQKSCDTLGRSRPTPPCPLRSDYQRDRDRIIHCKAFRRLKHKTQVFLSPEGDHYRTRLTHTLEVAQIARTMARALRLNEDLTEAISLGHDLGHTPFGHAGEAILNGLIQGGFVHSLHSLRVVDLLENNGQGLNLTYEVRDGIANHKYTDKPCTLEGYLLIYADRFAYINHDIEDAVRAGVLKEADLPKDCIEVLGKSKGERINNMILDLVDNSYEKGVIKQSPLFDEMTCKLHEFMFSGVYTNPQAKGEERKADKMLYMLFDYFMHNPSALPAFYRTLTDTYPLDRVVGDYIASFTDRYAIEVFKRLFVPEEWRIH